MSKSRGPKKSMKSKYADDDNSDGDLNQMEGMSKFKDDALTAS